MNEYTWGLKKGEPVIYKNNKRMLVYEIVDSLNELKIVKNELKKLKRGQNHE